MNLSKIRIVKKPNMSKRIFFKDDICAYSIALNQLVNTYSIHKGQAPFHTMSKDQDFVLDEKTKSVLINISREFDGVEDDLVFYERWLVNSDRSDKKRRYFFRRP